MGITHFYPDMMSGSQTSSYLIFTSSIYSLVTWSHTPMIRNIRENILNYTAELISVGTGLHDGRVCCLN